MIEKININGVEYHVTPVTEGELPTGVTVKVDGVVYQLGDPVVATAAEPAATSIEGTIEKISVNGAVYDIADVEAVQAERERAMTAERELQEKIDNIEGVESVEATPSATEVSLKVNDKSVAIPAATTEKAGAMSAEQVIALQAHSEGLAILNTTILNYNRKIGNLAPVDKATVVANLGTAVERGMIVTFYSANGWKSIRYISSKATAEAFANVDNWEDLDKDISSEIDKIKDGDTIVGQAREIHSRNGKNVTDSFLARTTAGSGTIGDGVASLKSVGGNIVKNLVDGTFESGWETPFANTSFTVTNGLATFLSKSADGKGRFRYNTPIGISGHIYYQKAFIKCSIAPNDKEVILGVMNSAAVVHGPAVIYAKPTTEWQFLSVRYKTPSSSDYVEVNIYDKRKENWGTISVYKYQYIDLTEMFGAGNEPDKDTCDRLFGTMDALPQGLSIANPKEFKSTGFNQFNPKNVLEGKAVVDNAIVSGDKNIAVVPCLPCKVGTGENNGYCIHGDFGEDIKVYLTPLNPIEVEGELYMHELTKDATTDTYVPQIKGYMLVEVPTTANLCAHFLWSEDKCERDSYEPYFESKIGLPTIPQMSEWGLAGIQNYCDTINLEGNKYNRKIEKIVLDGSQNWTFRANNTGYYSNIILKGKEAYPQRALTDAKINLVIQTTTSSYGTMSINGSAIYLNYNEEINALGVTEFKNWLRENPITIYYVLAEPEEYPLPKVDNNYISSDYGVEQFDSVVPCNANNLYYMRSLAGETRNFLDRLMSGLGTSDATVVADRILAVVNPAVEPASVEPETPIEE